MDVASEREREKRRRRRRRRRRQARSIVLTGGPCVPCN
jgi:hypothetical protein